MAAVAVCPSDEVLAAHLAGTLDEAARGDVRDHLDGCDACRALVIAAVRGGVAPAPAHGGDGGGDGADDLGGDGADADDLGPDGTVPAAPPARAARAAETPPPGDRLARGSRIDRYELGERLGGGGMGVVYAARDRQLDRAVALKLLRADGAAVPALAKRLVRESRLMAKVRHPAVITIYDAGRDGDRVYLAMERVDGTLRAWLEARPRAWSEVLDVFRRAGTGLAAAHRAGIVHRDFKPENVLIELDGDRAVRVLVTDFGVARAVGGDEPSSRWSGERGLALTATGVAIGTPAYMAPEQLDARAVDERSDVFGFAVALWEALFGARPFPGDDVVAIRDAMERGPQLPADRRRAATGTVPRWVTRALEAALSVDPARRPQTMDAMLRALDTAPRARRFRQAGLAAGTVAAIAVLAALLVTSSRSSPVDACLARGRDLDAAWSGDARAQIEAALARGLDATTAQRVLAQITQRTGSLRRGLAQVCAQDAATSPSQAARLACLDARRLELVAYLEGLAAGEPDAVATSLQGGETLALGDACLRPHPGRLEPMVPVEPVARRQVTRLRNRLRVVDQLRRDGHLEAATAALTEVASAVDAARFPPLDAELAWMRATVANDRTDPHATDLLRAAAATAERAQNDYIAASAWIQLVEAAVLQQDDLVRARQDLAQAQAAIDRLGGDADLEVTLGYAQALVLRQDAKYDQALAALERLRVRAHTDAPEQELVIAAALASFYQEAGRYDEALRASTAAHALVTPGSARDASLHAGRASLWVMRGAAPLAVLDAGIARAYTRSAATADQLYAIDVEMIWGQALASAADFAGALEAAEQAERDVRRLFGDRDAQIAQPLEQEGDALEALGRSDQALAKVERACEVLAFGTGDGSLDALGCRLQLADLHADRGAIEARAAVDQATADVAALTTALGPHHPLVAQAHVTLGHVEQVAGRRDLARAHLTAALAELTGTGDDRGFLGTAELALAQLADGADERRRWARLAVVHLATGSLRSAAQLPAAARLLR